MLGFDRKAARIAWTVALVALAGLIVFSIRHTVFIFVLSLFFAYMLYPLVRRISALLPARWPTSIGTAVVFASLLAAIALAAATFGPPIVDQAAALGDRLPALAQSGNVLDRLPLPHWLSNYRGRLNQLVLDNLQGGTSVALPVARQIGHGLLLVASNLIYVILVPVLAFLLIKDGARARDAFLAWTERHRHAAMWRGVVDDLDTLLGGYMRALLLLAVATTVVYATVFWVADVPYGLLLATLAGALEFIPVIGPLAAAAACIVVAGLSGYDHVLAIVGFIAGYRIFQDYVLNPYLMNARVTVPPLAVLFGLLAGEEIAGVVGVFLSVPVLATALILVKRIGAESAASVAPSAGLGTASG